MRRSIIIFIVFCLLLTSCSSSQGQQGDYYKKGVEAYNTGDYVLAKNYFQRAQGFEDSEIYLNAIDEITITSTMTVSETTKTTSSSVPDSTTMTTTHVISETTVKATTKATTQTTTKTTTEQRTIKYTDATYNGDIINGKPNGYGEMIWNDGSTYVGNWKDGLRHGSGTMKFSNGNKYIGEWDNDNFNGYGSYFWADGDKYEGEFKNNLRNGFGTYTWANGEVYSGQWKDGEMVPVQTTTNAATLNVTFQNELLNRTNNALNSARIAERNVQAQIDDLISRGGLYSSMMNTYKAQLATIQTDIANLNNLYNAIADAASNSELNEYETILISYENAY